MSQPGEYEALAAEERLRVQGCAAPIGPEGPSAEYDRLMAERQRLIDSGVEESLLMTPISPTLPIARNQAEVDEQSGAVPLGRCPNAGCRVETFRATKTLKAQVCPACYGTVS